MERVAGPGGASSRSEARADADSPSPKAGSSLLLRSLRSVVGPLAALWLVFALPHAALAAPPATAADRDCADFDNQAQAQDYFLDQGGPDSDPDRLDGDGDGVACDSLPCPCRRGRSPSPTPNPEEKPRERAQTIRARVTEVIDGDTIRVRSLERTGRSSYTVRLIGIDTPETKRPGTPVECGGPEGSANLERIAAGRRVRLRTDPTQDTFDRYDRLLAYIKLRGGPDAAIAQLRGGWAKVYVYGGMPFERVRAFRRAQRSARRQDRGVWGECGGSFHAPARASATQNRLVIRTDPRGVQSLGPWPVQRDPTLGAASDRFGAPSSKRRRYDEACRVAWRPIGLVVLFANFGLGNACRPDDGLAQRVVIRGSNGKAWRTRRGLRLGQREQAIRRRHRSAVRKSSRSWWIVTGRSFIGDCPPNGCRYPVLEARVRDRRVQSFRLFVGAAGD
jgi:endonuclease YncB( thermonuclease family)